MIVEKTLHAVSGYLGANVSDRSAENHKVAICPAITISRQVGARATSIGNALVTRFSRRMPGKGPQWTLYGNDLIQKVLRESNLPEELARFFPEDKSNSWTGAVEEIVGLHPSSFEVNRRCHEMILNLCRLGNAVIIGRCGNFIARELENVLNVRLVGSLSRRIAHLSLLRGEPRDKTVAFIRREDAERRRYAKENFNVSDLDDPINYDLVLNTDHFSDESAAALIEKAAYAKLSLT